MYEKELDSFHPNRFKEYFDLPEQKRLDSNCSAGKRATTCGRILIQVLALPKLVLVVKPLPIASKNHIDEYSHSTKILCYFDH